MSYGALTVLRSAAGWYIGREYEEDGWVGPGSRESDYYPTQEAAIDAVVQGFTLRMCPENVRAWNMGELDTCPGLFYQDKSFWREFVNVPGVDLSKYMNQCHGCKGRGWNQIGQIKDICPYCDGLGRLIKVKKGGK